MQIKTNCVHYLGDRPCKPHKQNGYHCDTCTAFQEKAEKILIIKLGAIGDVIRTTPLLRRIKTEHPAAVIYWLTYTPEVLSKSWVDFRLPVTLESTLWLNTIEFDWVLNLDKDPVAVAVCKSVSAKRKNGFEADSYGLARPISSQAEEDKWCTGLFDDLNQQNCKHYVQEIFEIAGYNFSEEEYIIERESSRPFPVPKGKKVVGLNTGCGGRWTSRLYPVDHWITLARLLDANGYTVVLLGGEQEDGRNKEISSKSNALYFSYFSLVDFISLMDHCDIVVTAVTMGMHLAIALQKKLVLFNNIFNPREFYMYNRGIIIEPTPNCDCYFTPVCPHDSMRNLAPEKVLSAVKSV
ncbi:MAG: glycosyltransferase family 9 protein [Ignavibacteria bacterium]|nr:glycosyltransferase family 9 protein [Ignavibacteria bacterium]